MKAEEIKEHSFYKSARVISNICEEFFSLLPVDYFCHCLVNSDGFYTGVMSDQDWAYTYLKHALYKKDVFSYSYDSFGLSCIIWNDLKLHSDVQSVRDFAKEYGYKSGLSLSLRTEGQCNFFGFASKQDGETNHCLMSNLDVLKKFIYYYLALSHKNELLLECYNKTYSIGKVSHTKNSFIETAEHKVFAKKIYTETTRYYFHVGDHLKYFTCREIECLTLLFKNYSAKQIAQKLGISYRVVEEYISNMRNKIGAFSTKKMCAMLGNNQLLMSEIELKDREDKK